MTSLCELATSFICACSAVSAGRMLGCVVTGVMAAKFHFGECLPEFGCHLSIDGAPSMRATEPRGSDRPA